MTNVWDEQQRGLWSRHVLAGGGMRSAETIYLHHWKECAEPTLGALGIELVALRYALWTKGLASWPYEHRGEKVA